MKLSSFFFQTSAPQILELETFKFQTLNSLGTKMTIPKSNCLRPGFAYFPRKIGCDEVKFALVLVVLSFPRLCIQSMPSMGMKMKIPKSNCLRPGFAYFPRKIGCDEVKFALVLVVLSFPRLCIL